MLTSMLCGLILWYAWTIDTYWGMKEMYTMEHSANVMGNEGDSAADHTAPPVTRLMIHSHNDEMQGAENALKHALSLGFGSIEIDVVLAESMDDDVSSPGFQEEQWSMITKKINDAERARLLRLAPPLSQASKGDVSDPASAPTLIAGHGGILIGTFQDLYLDPLIKILDEHNRGRDVQGGDWMGVYEDDPKAELQIHIDGGSDREASWPYIVKALQPCIDRGYATTYHPSNQTWSLGPLIFVGFGPISRVYYSAPRTIFVDAPLLKLSRPIDIPESDAGPATTVEWTSDLAPMASAKLPLFCHAALAMPPWGMIEQNLRTITYEAERRGIKSRWWGLARFNHGIRRRIWEVVKAGGADWVGGDDLEDLAQWERERVGKTGS